ncbi:MAG: PH domain-containing protein [Balneolaceae bacterium]|nr:MAG: PH domain-containing protein [Balneolaceae bacterium]
MENPTKPHRAHQLIEAKFDPRLKIYTFWGTTIFLIITIIGIVLLPFWLIFGNIYINRHFNSLFCELTTRALHFKKGVWFQTERTIPLDKIQDLTFKEGPVLRYFGLSYLKVETAGQSVQGGADMSLTGIIDARKFREMVLDQRDKITDKAGNSSPAIQSEENNLIPLLNEIHKTLKSIEQKVD